MSDEIKQPEGTVNTPGNGEAKKEEKPVTEFKVAEIWIKQGQLYLEASQEFWRDKIRAVGMLNYCIDLVKEAKVPDDKPRIIPAKGSFLGGVRRMMGKR